MSRNHRPTYPWPASAISPAEMALLYRARESVRVPINRLLARAVRDAFGQAVLHDNATAIRRAA